MRSLLRLLLLCLMAVALPVQGLAATGAVHCAAMHDRMQGATGHHHDDGSAHQHDAHHGGQEAASAPSGGDDHRADDGSPRVGSAFKCSACAACCVALGLPSVAITLPALPAEGLEPDIAFRAAVAFLTGGPERPPRTVLA
jgi:hypothetical protein